MQALNALKNQLLDLAIRGKLVPQIDEEAGVEQIGNVPEEVPFEIPEKWKWIRLDLIAKIISGRDLPRSEIIETPTGTPYITGASQFDSTGIIANRWTDTPIVISEKNDLLLTVKGTVGKLAINKIGTVHIARQIAAIRPINPSVVLTEYLFICFQSISSLLSKSANGMIPGIGRKDIVNRPIPLPPLKEQQRIVEKLGSLFSKIDVIQKSMDEVSQLSSSLEKQLLQSAISGKLVPQLDEEPEVGQIGQTPEETPFEIPKKWKWGKLSNYGNIVGGGTPSTSVGEYWNGEISWITPADLGKIQSPWVDRGAKSITESGLENSSAKKMPAGSIVYSSRAPIGRVAIAKNELCTSQGCKSFVPDPDLVDSKYAYFALTALTPDIVARASGTTFKEISGKQFGKTLIPIPPLREQRRIVEKLDKLMLEIQKLK